MSYDGDRLSRLDHKRNVSQDPVFVFVSKPHIAKLNMALAERRSQGFFRRKDLDWLIDRREDTTRRNSRLLKGIDLVSDVAQRLQELLGEENERGEFAHADRLARVSVVEHQPAAIPDDQHCADR